MGTSDHPGEQAREPGAAMTVRRVGPESADVVYAIIQDAFGSRPPLDPPAPALMESVEAIATRLALSGGLLARLGSEPAGALLLDPVGDTVWIRRFCVATTARGRGVAEALVTAALEAAEGRSWLKLVAREELPETISFWKRRGFVQTDRRRPYVELARPLPSRHRISTAAQMRDLGREIAADLRAGDVVVMSGDLGAGKTTLTQGLGAGLGVSGAVTSPTFIIAREHPGTDAGPDLVHVDAYRLGGAAELDDLDLDTSLDRAVTVVEWGEGMAEGLAESRIEIRITRDDGSSDSADGPETLDGDEPRIVDILRRGPRWVRDPAHYAGG
ncbi:tRNA (adenosine(37)-N6)-threonylcarbamoyltransferase complex ATPase subunit type 1 TsaE [Nocardioides sp. R-C-SC26]|uniref:tRNA (adenosine(37)-N6)-threonylcarbamoyltransferase complex ATPase subunit type 1 TsaE n=1 Tax=Nocardioides sp. R-C-SC26 TaxID=2870414 RepID=UPI001E38AEC0|nr:tRNA (adenosine(37)-N6)-threonylcarbamoyltransferase complex ATPase subunit type 1 TsaE [Nocardioides sp. R-C-SC26]